MSKAQSTTELNKKRRVRSNTKERNQKLFENAGALNNLNLSEEFSEMNITDEGDEARRKITSAKVVTEEQASKAAELAKGPIIDQEVTSQDAQSLDSQGAHLESRMTKHNHPTRRSEQAKRPATMNIAADVGAVRGRERRKEAEKYLYQLVGVLVHSGSTDSGHYYSFIKERDRQSPNYDKWFEFNDVTVKDFSPLNLKKECFGGQ